MLLVTVVPAAAAIGWTTTLIVDVPPEAAMLPPAKLQVIVPTGLAPDPGAQLQFVPVAETRFNPAGKASWTVALVAATRPELVTVMV